MTELPKQFEDQDIVLRYLQGRLSPDELDQFEDGLMNSPALAEQLELHQLLSEGVRQNSKPALNVLTQQSRQVTAPRQRHWRKVMLPTALAAGIAGLVFVGIQQRPLPVLEAAAVELGPTRGARAGAVDANANIRHDQNSLSFRLAIGNPGLPIIVQVTQGSRDVQTDVLTTDAEGYVYWSVPTKNISQGVLIVAVHEAGSSLSHTRRVDDPSPDRILHEYRVRVDLVN